jgi:hypothetical protein
MQDRFVVRNAVSKVADPFQPASNLNSVEHCGLLP